MTRLWDKGTPLDQRVLEYTAGEDHALDARLVEYDVLASIAHAEALHAAKHLSPSDLRLIRDALTEIGAASTWSLRERPRCNRPPASPMRAVLRLYLRDAVQSLAASTEGVADALDDLAGRESKTALPGYTHMQPAMPSSVALWAGGFAAELRDDAEGLAQSRRRIDKNPLGSAAGYGTPNLAISRETTRSALGFATTQEPVTAVQLSRGKAEAQVLFEICLLMQDLGRLAADLLLFYTQEFAFVALPDEFTTGSSIMPQKRNPDVFELIRGRSATAQACLLEALAVTAKLPSGYHRDLQLLKAPLFRGIDICQQTLALLPAALAGVRFR
ncbi:MAG TPA: lyase family protein, partial [Steroidobacteraceae bacterium]|nr:lyase family protein [Steroidobacteraceae bacterium]